MGEQFIIGKCVHCLGEVNQITDDHVFPKGWYPVDTPTNSEKWTAPSCQPCNAKYSQIEDRLFTNMILGFHPKDPRVAGLPKKAMRGLDPRSGSSIKDSMRRFQKRRSVLRGLIEFVVPPKDGVFPGFGAESVGGNKMFQKGFLIRKEDIVALGEKFVKGSLYNIGKIYIDHRYKIETNLVEDAVANATMKPLFGKGKIYRLCPAFGIWSLMAQDGEAYVWLMIFRIWDRFNLYSSVDIIENG